MTTSEQFEIEDDYVEEDDIEDVRPKISNKESLEKRRLIDELLAQRKLEKELLDLDFDDEFNDDDF